MSIFHSLTSNMISLVFFPPFGARSAQCQRNYIQEVGIGVRRRFLESSRESKVSFTTSTIKTLSAMHFGS